MTTNNKLKNIRKNIVTLSYSKKEGHIPSALSILDILWVLYTDIIKKGKDHFILSKGHASLGLYSILFDKKIINKETFESFCDYNSKLGGHADRNKVPGVEASTGSLGHGIAIATGIALGLKIRKNPSRVFVIIGDGECNEGTVWESAMLASHQKLNNLVCIVDYNHSTDRALLLGNIEEKFKAFGWKTYQVDGHSHDQLLKSLSADNTDDSKPIVIIANTIKGYGIKSIENIPEWHHKSPNKDEYEKLIKEIEQYA